MRRLLLVSSIPLALATGRTARADVVTDWNLEAIKVTKLAGAGTNVAPRALAITHIAVHNAVATIEKRYERYGDSKLTVTEPADVGAASSAAAAAALRDLLTKATPDGGADAGALDALKQEIQSYYDDQIAKIADGPAKTNGVKLGAAAAAEILQWRATDKADAPNEVNRGSTAEGKWRPTPPGNLPGLEPQWRFVSPFALTTQSQYRPPQPPVLQSAGYKTALEEVKQLGDKSSTLRTAAQTEIASFWAQATHLPFNEIARAVSAQKKLGVSENARLFALLNIALADSRIAAWDAKYTYNFWRPVTALDDAPIDGGPDAARDGAAETGTDGGWPESGATDASDGSASDDAAPDAITPDDAADGASSDGDSSDGASSDGASSDGAGDGAYAPAPAAWEPFLVTPNHPEYPSGHTTTGTAGAAVLDEIFGSTVDEFSVASDTLPGVVHKFTKFDDAALENGQSRIYGGIHYQFSNSEGRTLGSRVGLRAVNNFLRPVGDGGAGGDAGTTADASVGRDAGDASSDGATVGDARNDRGGSTDATLWEAGPDGDPDDSGCSCAIVGRTERGVTGGAAAGFFALAMTLVRRRRRVETRPITRSR